MKELYKQKASDYISAVKLRMDQLQLMNEGKKRPDVGQATQYMAQIQKGLDELQELIDIS